MCRWFMIESYFEKDRKINEQWIYSMDDNLIEFHEIPSMYFTCEKYKNRIIKTGS